MHRLVEFYKQDIIYLSLGYYKKRIKASEREAAAIYKSIVDNLINDVVLQGHIEYIVPMIETLVREDITEINSIL